MAIWYEGMSYLTASSDFAAARSAHLSGATDLYGASSAEYAAVENAWSMVGVGSPAPAGDLDGDGYDSIADGGTDCDDTNAAVNPGAIEVCNGIDDDCDGTTDVGAADETTWYTDADADGAGDPASSTAACSAPSGHVADSSDCDDTDATVYPGATEICNGVDDDCDGTVDQGASDASTWYADSDSDGYGDPSTSTSACSAPAGHVADSTDCNDAAAAVNPGASEICNGLDDDCDGTTDVGAIDTSTYYDDLDGDTYGAAASGTSSCSQPAGTVADGTDCDDTNAAVNPAAAEVCNGLDDDCDGTTDLGATDASTFYADADSDGYGDATSATAACSAPTGHVADATDCDDTNAAVNPGAIEVCNGLDDDCDGTTDVGAAEELTWYTDADADGYGDASSTTLSCAQPTGTVLDGSDCDDTSAAVNPGATEVCNGLDDDCDGSTDLGAADAGTWYTDADADTFGDAASSTTSCTQPSGTVADGSDCDDTNAAVNPGATEVCNGLDDDCDGSADTGAVDAGTWYADADADSYGDATSSTAACSAPTGHVADASDCNDTDAAVNPGATEVCNGLDDDCDGLVDDGISTSTCEGYAASYSGTLTGTGDSDVQPGGSWYYSSSSGTHSACLSGPSSADFDLYLYRWTPRGWRSVASSTGATSDETIAFSGGRGYYAWVVASASGSGDYTLALTTP